jgi:hypothetical protein
MKERGLGILGQEIFQDCMLPLTLLSIVIARTLIIITAVAFKRLLLKV